jgi:hypothetical protein
MLQVANVIYGLSTFWQLSVTVQCLIEIGFLYTLQAHSLFYLEYGEAT